MARADSQTALAEGVWASKDAGSCYFLPDGSCLKLPLLVWWQGALVFHTAATTSFPEQLDTESFLGTLREG